MHSVVTFKGNPLPAGHLTKLNPLATLPTLSLV
jgi:hypothetical protein